MYYLFYLRHLATYKKIKRKDKKNKGFLRIICISAQCENQGAGALWTPFAEACFDVDVDAGKGKRCLVIIRGK